MNRRLYFILPDVPTSKNVEKDLLLARVEDRRMHFLARRDIELDDLPQASILQKSDVTHGAFVGLLGGGVTGVIIGFILILLDNFGISLGFSINMGIVLALFILGALMGAWISGTLIGTSTPNSHIKQFEVAIEAGHVLLMIDVQKDRVEEITNIIKSHFPQAEEFGIDPTIPAFP